MTPQLFGKYLLLDRISAGGMGEVYLSKAGPRGFERYFAIKKILAIHEGSEEFVEMLIREAKISLGLVHPNIAQVFEFGQIDGQFFLAMEYVQGASVTGILSHCAGHRRGMPVDDALSVGIQVCRALDYAHNKSDTFDGAQEIVHRDVSPQNILVDFTGSVKLIDFGIAKAVGVQGVTATGMVKGKLGYMPPEQARSEGLDRRADIYSLGVVLWESLAGKRLFKEDNMMAVLRRVTSGDVPPIQEQVKDTLPADLISALNRAMATERSDRFDRAREFEVELSKALNGLAPGYTNHKLGDLAKLVAGITTETPGMNTIYADLHPEDFGAPSSDITNSGKTDPDLDGPATKVQDMSSFVRRETTDLEPPPERPPRRSAAPALVTVLLLLGLGAGGYWWSQQPTEPTGAVRTLAVRTEPPGAKVWLDGVERGVSPVVLEDVEEAKPHLVRVLLPGYLEQQRLIDPQSSEKIISLTLKRDPAAVVGNPPSGGQQIGKSPTKPKPRAKPKPKPRKPVAKKGCVAVQARPWAYVKVGSKKVGQTPIKCVELPAGRHTITLENPALGVSKNVPVTVLPEKTVEIREKL